MELEEAIKLGLHFVEKPILAYASSGDGKVSQSVHPLLLTRLQYLNKYMD